MKTPFHLLLPLMALPVLAAPPVVTLPLPQGQSMEFALVPVSSATSSEEGPDLFSSFSFELGNPQGSGYQQHRTWVSVSGTILHNGKWVIPVACTEVTRAQYASLMSPSKAPKAAEAQLPQTNISILEAQAFMDALNKWLSSDPAARKACRALASEQHGRPFARLPLLAEWEYVARGGQEVDKARFESGNPYADLSELEDSEVLMTRSAAKVKSQGAANPCGIYDMLGNVSELVQPYFHSEYYFGRSGGIQSCGANHSDKPEEAFAFQRREHDAYKEDGTPWKSSQIGFRPVLGSSIYAAGMGLNEIDASWEDYVMSSSSQRLTMRPPDEQTMEELVKIRQTLTSLVSGKLSDVQGVDEQTRKMLETLNQRIAGLQETTNRALAQSAESGVRTLSAITIAAMRELTRLNSHRKALAVSQKNNYATAIERAQGAVKNSEETTALYWEVFRECNQRLASLDAALVEKSLNEKEQELNTFDAKHLPYFRISRKHYEKYRASLAPSEDPRKMTDEERKAWEADILADFLNRS